MSAAVARLIAAERTALPAVSIAAIQEAVCRRDNMRMIEMSSHRRSRSVARPRQLAMYLARELTPHTLPVIGRHFGHRNHTTVMHGVRTVARLAATDAGIAEALAALLGELSAEPDPNQLMLPLGVSP